MSEFLELLATMWTELLPHLPVLITALASLAGVVLGDRLRLKSQQSAERTTAIQTAAASLLGAAQQLNQVSVELSGVTRRLAETQMGTFSALPIDLTPAETYEERRSRLQSRRSELRSKYAQEHAILRILSPQLAGLATDLELDHAGQDLEARVDTFARAAANELPSAPEPRFRPRLRGTKK